MICKNCSAEFEGKFCPECGAPAEQEIEQVTEQVTQAASEPVIEETEDVVVGSVTPPTTVAEDEAFVVSEPVSESYYYEPAMGNGYAQEQPKKKKKVGLIIAIVIIVLAVAAFCVAAFTDLFFSKQAQFVSILNNMGSDVEAEFADVDGEYIETKYSVKLNEKNDMVTELIPADVVEIVNSIGLTARYGEENAILTVLENDKKLADLSLLIKDDETFAKADFSDVVMKYSASDTDEYEDMMERIGEVVDREITALLEGNEVVKGDYAGAFDLDSDVKTLTITLDEAEINDFYKKLVEEITGENDLKYTLNIKELTISALYDGAFAFARNSLGVSVVVDNGVGKTEIIFFSNKESSAIYGFKNNDGYLVATDYFEINGRTQSGVVNFETDIEELALLGNLSCTYTAKDNNVQAQATIVEGTDKIVSKCSMVNENGKVTFTLQVDVNQQELFSFNAEASACERVDVEIDTSKAVDFSDYNFDAQEEALDELIDGLQTLVEENEDSEILALLEPMFRELTPLEQYMEDEYGISFGYTEIDAPDRAAFVGVDSGIIDVLEYGCDGDHIMEMAETLYISTAGYTSAQQEQLCNALQESFAFTELMESVYVETYMEDGFIVQSLRIGGLDNPENVREYVLSGLLIGDSATESLSLDMTEQKYLLRGYERVE